MGAQLTTTFIRSDRASFGMLQGFSGVNNLQIIANGLKDGW